MLTGEIYISRNGSTTILGMGVRLREYYDTHTHPKMQEMKGFRPTSSRLHPREYPIQ